MHSSRNSAKTKLKNSKPQSTSRRQFQRHPTNTEKLRTARARVLTANRRPSATSLHDHTYNRQVDPHRVPHSYADLGTMAPTASSVAAAQDESMKMVNEFYKTNAQNQAEHDHRHNPLLYTVATKHHPVPRQGQESVDDLVHRVEDDFHTKFFTTSLDDGDGEAGRPGRSMNPRQKALKCADNVERMAVAEKKAQLSYELDASEFQPSITSTLDLPIVQPAPDLNSGISCPPRGVHADQATRNPIQTSKRSYSALPPHLQRRLDSFPPAIIQSIQSLPPLSISQLNFSTKPNSSVHRSTDTTTGHFTEHDHHQHPQHQKQKQKQNQPNPDLDLQFRQNVPLSENGFENYKSGTTFNPDLYVQQNDKSTLGSKKPDAGNTENSTQNQHRHFASSSRHPSLSPTTQTPTTSYPTHTHPSHPLRQEAPKTMRKVWRKGNPDDDEFGEVIYEETSSPHSFSSTIRAQSHAINRKPDPELCMGAACDDFDVILSDEYNQKEYTNRLNPQTPSRKPSNFRANYHKNKSPTSTTTASTPSPAESPQHQSTRSISTRRKFSTSRNFNNIEEDDTDHMNVDRKHSKLYTPDSSQASNAQPVSDTTSNWVETGKGMAENRGTKDVDVPDFNYRSLKGMKDSVDNFQENLSKKGLGGPMQTIANAASGIVNDGANFAQSTSIGRKLAADLDEAAAAPPHISSRKQKRLDRQAQRGFSTGAKAVIDVAKDVNEVVDNAKETVKAVGTIASAAGTIVKKGAEWVEKKAEDADQDHQTGRTQPDLTYRPQNTQFNENKSQRHFSTNNRNGNNTARVVASPGHAPFVGVPDSTGARFNYQLDPEYFHTKEYFINQQKPENNPGPRPLSTYPDPSQYNKDIPYKSTRHMSTIQNVAQNLHKAIDKAAYTAEDISRGATNAAHTTSAKMEDIGRSAAHAAQATSAKMEELKSVGRQVQSEVNTGLNEASNLLNVAKSAGKDLKGDLVESVGEFTQQLKSGLDNTRPPSHAQQRFPDVSDSPAEQIAKVNKQQLDQTGTPTINRM